MLYKPYTYLLFNKITKQFYYGVRYASKCNPKDFWKDYYTSSNHVHKLIEEYGKDSFEFEIRKIFDNEVSARTWESKVLRRIKAVDRNDFLNKHDSYGPPRMIGKNHPLYKIGHTEQTKQKMRKKHRKDSLETRVKKSVARIGKNNPMYGKFGNEHPAFGNKHSSEFKEKQAKRFRTNNPMKNPNIIEKIKLKKQNLHWWTNGKMSIQCEKCPGTDWKIGRLIDVSGIKNPMYGKKRKNHFWWTNGKENKRGKNCPGLEWRRGKTLKIIL